MKTEITIRQQHNRLYRPVLETKARYIHLWGGRGRGGSYFATDYFLRLITAPEYFRGYFLRQVAGDVKESLWRDFKDRISENETVDEKLFEIADFTMVAKYIPTGNVIITKGFKKSSGNQTAKLKSIAGATHVLIEEAEETAEEDFNQLDDSIRTTKGDIQIVMVFNPPHKDHWIMKRWYNLEESEVKGYYRAHPKQDDSLLSIHSVYQNNIRNINQSTITNYERYKETNFEYYATMIKGLVSEGMKGVIFKTWKPVTNTEFVLLPYDSFYGLDFGFGGSPAALVEIKTHNDDVWVKELLYEVGYTNPMLATRFEQIGIEKSTEIYGDSAEPKSIQELKDLGWNVIGAVKGPDSIRAGINFMLSKKFHYVEDSRNLIIEKEGYRWALDKNKNPIDKPVDELNHCFVGDTQIKTNNGLCPIKKINVGDWVETSFGYKKVLKKWDNGVRLTNKYKIQFDDFYVILECTPNHKIKTNIGWIPISQLHSGIMVFLNKHLMGRHTDYGQKKDISHGAEEECMSMYGNFIMGNAQMDTTFITGTIIHGIIGQKISSSKKFQSIDQNMAKTEQRKIRNGWKDFGEEVLKRQSNGMPALKELNGINNTPFQKVLVKERMSQEFAFNVVENLSQKRRTTNSAQAIVSKNSDTIAALTILKKYAVNAENHSCQTKLINNGIVVGSVVRNIEKEDTRLLKVYDLTIDEMHEYFANGILVHNCMDGIRQSLYTKYANPGYTWTAM